MSFSGFLFVLCIGVLLGLWVAPAVARLHARWRARRFKPTIFKRDVSPFGTDQPEHRDDKLP